MSATYEPCTGCQTSHYTDRACPRFVQLTMTSEGTYHRSGAREIEPGSVRRVMAVMGVRLFYGITTDGSVVEFTMTGGAFAAAEKAARAICPVLLDTTFGSKRFAFDGAEAEVTRLVDLTPAATTAVALRVGRAMGWLS